MMTFNDDSNDDENTPCGYDEKGYENDNEAIDEVDDADDDYNGNHENDYYADDAYGDVIFLDEEKK